MAQKVRPAFCDSAQRSGQSRPPGYQEPERAHPIMAKATRCSPKGWIYTCSLPSWPSTVLTLQTVWSPYRFGGPPPSRLAQRFDVGWSPPVPSKVVVVLSAKTSSRLAVTKGSAQAVRACLCFQALMWYIVVSSANVTNWNSFNLWVTEYRRPLGPCVTHCPAPGVRDGARRPGRDTYQ
jgi:hypothetical protein